MQTGNERTASSRDGTELDVSGPDQNQKKGTYVSLLRVTEGSLRAAFPLLITGRACQRHYLISHIPLKSFQWVGFKGWYSGRSCLRPPVAAAVYKPRSALICWLLWYEVFRGSFIRWKEVGRKGKELFQYYNKKKERKRLDKKYASHQSENAKGDWVFFVCGFDLKQTQYHSQEQAVHMSVCWSSKRAKLLWTV